MIWLYAAIGISLIVVATMCYVSREQERHEPEPEPEIRLVRDPDPDKKLREDVIRSIAMYDMLTMRIEQLSLDPRRYKEIIDGLKVQQLSLSTRIERALVVLPIEEWPEGSDRFRP